jgi:uncharacterized protein
MFQRLINILDSNSFFLFGARATGKTSYLKTIFTKNRAFWIDLLEGEQLAQLQADPTTLGGMIERAGKEWIVIDEIQKIPALLDTVHLFIEKHQQKFALTGSSARKLKRGSANMLAGRAFVYKLFPLTYLELGDRFDLDTVLSFGALPKIFDFATTRERILFLRAYTETYIKEEILIEQLIRNSPPFRKFLEVSAQQDSEVISYSSIARDVLVDPKIISNYYTILEDTLLGFFLEPFHTSLRKRQKNAPKFYLFDLGVRRTLGGTIDLPVTPKSFEYGSLFESFIVNEIHRLLTYSERSFKLSFVRIDDKFEIDLVVERAGLPTFFIEIKSSSRVNEDHSRALAKLTPNQKGFIPLLLSNDPISKKFDRVLALHWQEGFKELGIV